MAFKMSQKKPRPFAICYRSGILVHLTSLSHNNSEPALLNKFPFYNFATKSNYMQKKRDVMRKIETVI